VPGSGQALRRTDALWISLGGDALKALLSAPTVARTAHFVLQAHPDRPPAQELPTGAAPDRTVSVDNSSSAASSSPASLGLALVVPKRHAKRAATRNLVKRQMREVMRQRVLEWSGRQVLIRQRSAFALQQYRSASSAALRHAVRGELDLLFAQAKQA
jgi:ribonuclease P protein component